MKFSRVVALLMPVFLAATSHSAWACSACWGATSDNKMNNAAAVGIGVMVALMFVMLGSLFAFGWHLVWRAKHPLPDYDELLSEENTDPNDKTADQDPES
jgi:hypothetical protein